MRCTPSGDRLLDVPRLRSTLGPGCWRQETGGLVDWGLPPHRLATWGREMLEKRREEPKQWGWRMASAHCLRGLAVLRWVPRGQWGVVGRQGGMLTVLHGCRGAKTHDRRRSSGRCDASAQAVWLAFPALVFDWRLEGYRREEEMSKHPWIKWRNWDFQSSHRWESSSESLKSGPHRPTRPALFLEMLPAWRSGPRLRQSLWRSVPGSQGVPQSAPPLPNSWPGGRRTLAAKTWQRSGGRNAHDLRLTLMLFLNVYPGRGRPFFLSMGSLKMTSCSNRKTLLSLALDGTPFSCSLTKKVSCWSSFPWAVILPWGRRNAPWMGIPLLPPRF